MLIRREHGGFSAADVRAPIARAFDFIVHVARQENGRRIVREVIELAGMRGPEYDLRPASRWTAEKGFEPCADYRTGPRVKERFRVQARRAA